MLIPTGGACEDSWLIASALAPFTEGLTFLAAVRPGVQSPTQAARMTSTLDQLSNGRVLITVVSGGDPQKNRGDGPFWELGERYRAAEEFLYVYKPILAGKSVSSSGDHIKVEDARIAFPRRREFGRYVQETLSPYVAAGAIRPIRSPVVSMRKDGDGWRLRDDAGATYRADVVAMAITHCAPTPPPPLRGLKGDPQLIADPVIDNVVGVRLAPGSPPPIWSRRSTRRVTTGR